MHAVDILLPYYGDVKLMKAAVDSVLSQTLGDWRLTVLDDAYPDPEPQRWFASLEDPRVTYLRNETNLGANGNYRKALDMARAPIVVIMGADDVMLPSYLEHVIALLEKHPEASVAQPGVEIINETGHRAKTLTDSVKSLTAPSGPYRRPSQASRSRSRSRQNSRLSPWARPGTSTSTASGSGKPVR
jgi:GT2 family glycosyltransferase